MVAVAVDLGREGVDTLSETLLKAQLVELRLVTLHLDIPLDIGVDDARRKHRVRGECEDVGYRRSRVDHDLHFGGRLADGLRGRSTDCA